MAALRWKPSRAFFDQRELRAAEASLVRRSSRTAAVRELREEAGIAAVTVRESSVSAASVRGYPPH
jgi:8-oxo-dGTP pyrophosphatase MutT (NUDIX family)